MLQLQVFFSNRVELLFENLKQSLFGEESSPFAKRLIAVPSPAMKSWLMLQMANDAELGIAAGLEIAYLEQIIKQFVPAGMPQQLTGLELALAIENEIRNIIENSSAIPPNEQDTWQPLFDYLKVSPQKTLSRKTERRLTILCDKLAGFFSKYGIYGENIISEWEENNNKTLNWQVRLWNRLYNGKWGYPCLSLTSLMQNASYTAPRNDMQVHIFSISHLPHLYHRFLEHLAGFIPVYYYILSPCQAFWSDLKSDRESRRMQAYWKNHGANEQQQLALEEFLRDCNALLANFGRVGREMAQQIEDSQALSSEDYIIPANALIFSQYEDLHTEEVAIQNPDHPLTMLEAVQTDLVLLRNPDRAQKINLQEGDQTIQVHIAPSRMREVQVLYDALLQIIHKHSDESPPICPSDILVMTPCINDYAPFIKAVFGSSESQLLPQMLDLAMPAKASHVQAFLHLINLPFGRWEASALMQLLDYPAFQQCHEINPEEVRVIREWIKMSDVRWGHNANHRNELLVRDHCQNGMIDSSPIGTWEYGLSRLLSGIAMSISSNEHLDSIAAPLESVDPTQGPLLGKFSGILRALREDLRCLNDGTSMSLNDWADYLRCLCEAYFHNDHDSETEDLMSCIAAFRQAGQKIGNDLFPFSTIRHHLLAALNKPEEIYRETELNAVRFCSLLPMRAIPAKVVVLIGMEEGAYPRHDTSSSINLLQGNAKADFCPSQTDYDRYLFLEALLSARKYFIMIYQGSSASDGKEQAPSLLITELLTYLDKACTVSENPPSQCCVRKHPFHAFDHSYYESGSLLRSYSLSNYKAARAYYHDDKSTPHNFIPAFTTQDIAPKQNDTKPIRIHLKELVALAKNPIKAYFNKTLGVYLDNPEMRLIKNEEDLDISFLQSYVLKQNALTQPTEHILKVSERQGKLPVGPFKPVMVDKISRDIATLKDNLENYGVSPENIFRINISEHCQKSDCENTQWNVPVLKFPYRGMQIHIVGALTEVTHKGLIAHIKDDKTDIIKAWPEFLVLSCLAKKHGLPIENQLLPVKSSKGKAKSAFFSDPQKLLEQFLDYYFMALEHVSPLIPEWVPHLIAHEPEEFHQKMRKSLTDQFNPIRNDYLHWALKDHALPDPHELVTHWQPHAKLLYEDLYENWFK